MLRVPHIDSLPVASCDGLILISHYKLKKLWAVWNPYTRKSIKLSPIVDDKIESHPGRPFSGIGYDPATDDYKVVRVARYYDSIDEGPALRTFVYNLKLGHWRRLDNDLPCSYAPTGGREGANGVFVNGALHWFGDEFQNKRCLMRWIIALDLVYARVPSNTRRPPNNEIDRNLSVVDGCLFLSCNYFDLQLDGWMMMKDTNSWVLLFSFTQHESRISGHLQFLAYLKDKRLVLIQHAHNVFLWFDIDKKLSKMVALNSVPLNLTSQVFPASLVRLNDGGHGSIAAKGRKRKRKRAKDGDDASIAAKGTSRGRKRKRGLKLTLTTTGF
ncbi:hypothetical protein ACJIZ3_005564 [Penstemon smallii]|uniref:F-box associated beta-propeller type 1 domain-containing protein n=1 Tax=Penstemon smallii TaxID=265156 RepID=A0ABD3S5E0_9LAMI